MKKSLSSTSIGDDILDSVIVATAVHCERLSAVGQGKGVTFYEPGKFQSLTAVLEGTTLEWCYMKVDLHDPSSIEKIREEVITCLEWVRTGKCESCKCYGRK